VTLFEWLVDGAQGAGSSAEIVTRIGDGLVAEGVAVDRISAFVSTLHPDVYGRMFEWRAGERATVMELSHAMTELAKFRDSPIWHVYRERVELRRRLADPAAPHEFPMLDDLARDGFTDYFALPMVFTTGQGHSITFATRRDGGFRDGDLALMRQIVRPLARIAEIYALRRTAANLLDTYVGRNAGERVLAGRIRRGNLEELRAVIWFSDLRGFTQLSQRATAREVIDALNQVFECQVEAVERRGGEVLKFMGDGMLAIFPLAAEHELPAACDAALDAAAEAQQALAARRTDLAFGVALHVGEIAYGNIGGKSRLDFTAIGPAVNVAARLEGLTAKLGRPIVISSEVAAHTRRPLVELGSFTLKGVEHEIAAHAPA
jgi:adenylate cyclase